MFSQKLLTVSRFPVMEKYISNYVKGPHNFVNGERVLAFDGLNSIPIIQPGTGKTIDDLKCSGSKDIDNAVVSARKAYSGWSKLSGFERAKFLRAAADLVREKTELIAQLEVCDTGKPIWEARLDISCCADALEYYSAASTTLEGSFHQLANGNFAHVCREPLGVVGGIGAWNYPFQVMTWKCAPALASGNTFVFKPSEHTPLSAIVLAEIFLEAGVPPGVVNVVQGDGNAGKLLCSHPGIAKISFTGSVKTGQNIMKLCAESLKRVTLELGGKSPLLVFEDADIVQAIKATMIGNFLTQGEVCTNCTRVFVHQSIIEQFTRALTEATRKMVIGNPMDEKTTVGATISKEHAEKVLKFIEEAKEEGAHVEYGGEQIRLEDPELGGFYLSPCILTNCNDDMKIVKEEVFGSVVCILPFNDVDEVIQRANNSPYGLAAGVITKDLKCAHQAASKLEAGIVWINNYNVFPNETPFGGYKFSGFGRENGMASLNDYTQTKTVYVELNDIDCPIYKC